MNIKSCILTAAALISFQAANGMNYLNFANPHVVVTGPQFLTAAGTDNMQSVIDYIAAGFPINVTGAHGSTALHNAVREMNFDIVEVLLHAQANVNSKGTFGYTPLHWAIINNDEEVVQLLLRANGIDVNITCDTNKTALHLAAERGLAAVASELLLVGARTDIADATGLTALQIAQQRNKKDTVEVINAFIDSRNAALPVPAPAPAQGADQDQDDECVICYDNFDNGDIAYTPCMHKFHGHCLNQLQNFGHTACPVCRTPING